MGLYKETNKTSETSPAKNGKEDPEHQNERQNNQLRKSSRIQDTATSHNNCNLEGRDLRRDYLTGGQTRRQCEYHRRK